MSKIANEPKIKQLRHDVMDLTSIKNELQLRINAMRKGDAYDPIDLHNLIRERAKVDEFLEDQNNRLKKEEALEALVESENGSSPGQIASSSVGCFVDIRRGLRAQNDIPNVLTYQQIIFPAGDSKR